MDDEIKLRQANRRFGRRARWVESGVSWGLLATYCGSVFVSLFGYLLFGPTVIEWPTALGAMVTPPIAGAVIGWWIGGISERRQVGFCKNCDYDLTGLTSNRCPECGNEINPAKNRFP